MRQAIYRLSYQVFRTDSGFPFRNAILWACFFLLLFSFTGRAWAQAADSQRIPIISTGPGLQFAIADFDGDHRPDLAYVGAGQDNTNADSYWVDFRLSSQEQKCVRVIAPPGGLLIEARDVNGDQAVDLVVSTAWLRQPVAILLNDGRGSFKAANPGAFPGAFQRAESNRFSGHQHLICAVDALTQSRLGVCTEKPLSHRLSETQFDPRSSSAIFLSSHYVSTRGRAPPICS